MHTKGLFDFLMRNADLDRLQLCVRHQLSPDDKLLCNPPKRVRFSLVKRTMLFKTEVWSLEWYEGFNEHVALPDHLCNDTVRGQLAREQKEKEEAYAQQNCQATLFHANSGT